MRDGGRGGRCRHRHRAASAARGCGFEDVPGATKAPPAFAGRAVPMCIRGISVERVAGDCHLEEPVRCHTTSSSLIPRSLMLWVFVVPDWFVTLPFFATWRVKVL